MEDSGQNQTISMAVGLIIVLLAAGLGFLIYRAGHTVAQNATNQVADLGVTLEESEFTQHDGEIMTGSQLISVVTGYQGEAIKVTIDKPSVTIDCATLSSTDFNAQLQKMQESTDASYVNPRKKYKCACTYEDGIVTQMTFTLQS